MVNIFYGDLAYSSIVESPAYTPEALLGILGYENKTFSHFFYKILIND
jgi:hypothetical protein